MSTCSFVGWLVCVCLSVGQLLGLICWSVGRSVALSARLSVFLSTCCPLVCASGDGLVALSAHRSLVAFVLLLPFFEVDLTRLG